MRFTTPQERCDQIARKLLEMETVNDVPTAPLLNALPEGTRALSRQADLILVGSGEVKMIAFAPALRGSIEGEWWRFADVDAETTTSSTGPSTKVVFTDRQSGFVIDGMKSDELARSGWKFRTLSSEELEQFGKTRPHGVSWDPYSAF